MTRKGGNSWNVLSKPEAFAYGFALLIVGIGIGMAVALFCGRTWGW